MPFRASSECGFPVFTTATFLGVIPWTMSFAFFGATLGEVIAAQEMANPGCAAKGTCAFDYSALTADPIITGLALAALSLVPVGIHWLWRSRTALRR